MASEKYHHVMLAHVFAVQTTFKLTCVRLTTGPVPPNGPIPTSGPIPTNGPISKSNPTNGPIFSHN